MARLGLIGAASCIAGLLVSFVAYFSLYPFWSGSTFDTTRGVLFLALFFPGVVIALLGLGTLIYLVIRKRQLEGP